MLTSAKSPQEEVQIASTTEGKMPLVITKEKKNWSRTISDLEGQDVITDSALREAIDTLVPMIEKREDYPYRSYPYYANDIERRQFGSQGRKPAGGLDGDV